MNIIVNDPKVKDILRQSEANGMGGEVTLILRSILQTASDCQDSYIFDKDSVDYDPSYQTACTIANIACAKVRPEEFAIKNATIEGELLILNVGAHDEFIKPNE